MQEKDLKQHRQHTMSMPPFSRNQTCTQDAFPPASSEKINILEAAQDGTEVPAQVGWHWQEE